MNKKLKDDWEARSKEFGDAAKGVMFATFPPQVNDIFHSWELSLLKTYFPHKKNVTVLDIGAGYGRLSIPLSHQFKHAFFHGIDISSGYIHLFNKKMGKRGKGVVGDLSKLPYRKNAFDYIMIVTVLMYLNDREIQNLLSEVKRIAKKMQKL